MQRPRTVTRKHHYSPTMPAILLAYFFSLLLTPVVTYPPDGSLRLSGYGSSSLAGRLDVYLDGNWSSVCSDGFDYKAATVACKQMGLGSAVDYESYPSNRYGANAGQSLPSLVCTGSELHILRCQRRSGDGCPSHQGAAVACSNASVPYNGEMRLVGGAFPSEGMAELYYNYRWAPLCAAGFSWNVSHALCRQMGYTGANVFRPIHTSGIPSWTPGYSCDARQTCFFNCTSSLPPAAPTVCPEGGVWVECGYDHINGSSLSPSGSRGSCTFAPLVATNVSVRLGGCGFPWCDTSVGRVELFYGSSWGTVCDSAEFSFNEASVICTQLGFTSASKIYRDNLLGLGPGSGPIYSLSCLGVERSVAECSGSTHAPMYANCDHYDDTVLQCSSAFPPYGSLLLDEGAGSAGALLVFAGEEFQAVCGAGFGEREGAVACRQLGYPGVIAVKHGSYYNSKHTLCNATRIFECVGNETQLMACPSRVPHAGECRAGLDEVGLICSTLSSSIENIYLTNMTGPTAGVLQVVLYGEPGLVCGDGFGQAEGQVACRQLGFGTAASVTPSIYSPDMGPALVNNVSCIGFEGRLDVCQYSLPSPLLPCSTAVILNCSQSLTEPEGSLRLSGGNMTSGQLQMYLNGEWVGLCGLLFTPTAASVACHQLGLGTPVDYCTDGCFPSDSDVDVYFAQYDCSGEEMALISCVTREFKSNLCDHSAYVGLSCQMPTLLVGTPTVAPGNITTPPGSFFGLKPLYFYLIVGSAGAVLIFMFVLACSCACLYKRRKQSEWSVAPDPLPAHNALHTTKSLEKKEVEDLRTVVVSSPLCLNVYDVGGPLSSRIEPTPPPSYEEVERFSS